MKQTTIQSAVLGGGAGLLFLILRGMGGGLLGALGPAALLMAGGLGGIWYWNCQRLPARAVSPAPAVSAPPPDPARSAAQTSMKHIREMLGRIRLDAVRKEAAECVALCDEILTAARQGAAGQDSLKKFFTRYLPMFEQMLEHYLRCEGADVLPQPLVKQFTDFLDVMEAAMKKLKENLYASDVMSLAVNMEVLEQLYQLDGLADTTLTGRKKEGSDL